MRTFVFIDDRSNKFWNIDLQGDEFTVTFGKVGTRGQTQVKAFPDEAAAHKAHDKLVAEKLAKGYVETTVRESSVSPLQRALEQTLAENLDDLAAHSAYADYLMEQGDPRGEFIQMQLALEDPSRGAEDRARLQARARELQRQHGRQWMGDVGRFLDGDWSGADKPFHYQFRRGWLDLVRLLPAPDAAIAALARSPEARLLRRLEIVYDMRFHPFDFDIDGPNAALRDDERPNEVYEGATLLPALLGSPYLTNLRTFELGFGDPANAIGYSTMVSPFEECNGPQVIELLQKCPHLEELYLNTSLVGIADLFASPALSNLRVLQYYYGSDYATGNDPGEAYPLTVLANNVSLRRLTTLRLHPGRDTAIDVEELNAILRSPNLPSLTHMQVHLCTRDAGDEVCGRIVESGILRRLETLDIAYAHMTDEGARLLADCPDLKHLASLDVSRNALTPVGIAALEATGIRVVADDQHAVDGDDYSYDVDME